MEREANRPADGALCALDVGVEVAPVTGEPLALVHEARVLRRNRSLEMASLGVEHQVFESPVRRVKDDSRRRLVDLARLDSHEAVLDHVDAADAVQAAQTVELLNQGYGAGLAAIERRRYALLEGQLDDPGAGGGGVHRRSPAICVLGGFEESIFQDPGLDGSPPQVLVHTVRRFGLYLNGEVVPAGVGDLLLPGHRHPIPKRREDLELGVEGPHRDVEADLVVSLASRTVPHPGRALAGSNLDEELGDQRPAQGGGQRVLPLVQRARLQCWPAKSLDERLPGVEYVGLEGAGGKSPLADAVEIWLAAEVHRQGNHVEAAALGEPSHGDGGIETTREGEDDLLCLHPRGARKRPRWRAAAPGRRRPGGGAQGPR